MAKKKKKKKKKTLLYFFIQSIKITSMILLILIALGFIIVSNLFPSKSESDVNHSISKIQEVPILHKDSKKFINKNIAIFGVDKGHTRTDTILVLNFNSQLSKISLLSVPRDTKVTWTDEQKDKALELGRSYNYVSKITDMSSLSGIKNIRYFAITTIENMLDIKIDNYVVVDTKILIDLVDAVGGVEFDVPRVMQYSDPYQNLYINLRPGLQTLDGKASEGLLRWRHNNSGSEQYPQGDVGRIETQQLFLKALMNKLLNPEIFNNIIPLIKTIYENVITDMDLTDILEYLPYLKNISMDNVTMHTLPGVAKLEDLWYYIIDEEQAKELTKKIFNNSIETLPEK